jgi:hypothetical protein
VRFNAPPGSATESQGLAVRYAAAKRRVSPWRWYFLLAAVVALPLYFGVQLLLALVWVTAPGQVELQQAFVKAGAAGHVTMLAAEGQRVAAGEAIAQVAPWPPLNAAPESTPAPAPGAQAATAAHELAAAREVAAAREGAARGTLALALQQLAERDRWRRTIAGLVAQGAATAAEQQSAEARWAEADAQVVRARADLGEAQAAVQRTQGAGGTLPMAVPPPSGASAAAWPVPAPIAGRVVRVSARSGEWVAPDGEVAVIQSEAPALVRGWLPPADARHAREGAEAVLHFFDGTSAPARVLRVEREATRMPPERLGPLAVRGQALVILLQPLAPLPEAYRVHELPVEVRFRRW